MTIPSETWLKFVKRLEKIDQAAAKAMLEYISKNGGIAAIPERQLIDYAYGIATKYGEASAALSAEMYDAIAAASGASVPAAVVANTVPYKRIEADLSDVLTFSVNDNLAAFTTAKHVKKAGQDTMLQNAVRDGAEWAWVPNGDSCQFCLMLASNGWQKGQKNGGADHIHANCNCSYVVRFNGRSGVKGYDPDKYKAIYDNAEGDNWREKLNFMRREQYAENADEINAKKRAAYAMRKEEQE